MAKPHALIIGGSIAALGATLALTSRGFAVTCIEKDAAPMPKDHHEAWRTWARDGAGQTRHSHVLLAPLLKLIRAEAPDFLERLLECGAEVLTFADIARNTFENPQFEPEDEDIAFIACRRVVFEYLLRRYMLDRGGFHDMDGSRVESLVVDHATAPPTVRGVVAKTPAGIQTLEADIVIDASGRNTQLERWFEAADLPTPEYESHPCGIFYTSRFYQLNDGADYPAMDGRQSLAGGVQGVDLGYLKVGLFRSDNRTFSITLAADPADTPMRAIANDGPFDIAVDAIKATQAWVDPQTSQPISKVYLYGNLTNSRRNFIRDGAPLLQSFYAIGDSHVHTNPIAGRGCALGWVSAFDLANSLASNANPIEAALRFDAAVQDDVLPWYRTQVRQDEQALEINRALQRGEDPFDFVGADGAIDEAKQRTVIFRKGIRHASREDINVLRALFRQVNLLDTPESLTKRSDLFAAVVKGYEAAKEESLTQRPLREDLLARFRSA